MDGCASSLTHSSPLTLVEILLCVTWSRISDVPTRRADASRMLEINIRDAPERAAEDLKGTMNCMLFGDCIWMIAIIYNWYGAHDEKRWRMTVLHANFHSAEEINCIDCVLGLFVFRSDCSRLLCLLLVACPLLIPDYLYQS